MKRSFESLSKLAMFLDKLMHMPVVHNSAKFNEEKRMEYYKELKGSIQLSLCEASYDIFDTAPELKQTWFGVKASKMKFKCLPKQLDLSSAELNDFSFYNKLFRFLKQVKNRLRKLGKKGKRGSKNSQRKSRRTTKV